MPEERRRSDRVKPTIPLRVHGLDDSGKPFECEARAIDLSRHGAWIQISRVLRWGQMIRLVNLASRRKGSAGRSKLSHSLAPATVPCRS